MTLRPVRSAAGDVLDRCLVVFFDGAHSYSGEDTLELHLHGGPAVVTAVLDDLAQRSGFRAAEAGEFTRRAMENGRLDLTEVEGLADLIQAETEAQRRLALRQAEGFASGTFLRWRDELIRARAYVEADIDFADEDDVAADVSDRIWDSLARLRQDFVNHISSQAAERLRNGLEFVILGPPNAGKSTLINVLARREAAIVTDVPGTTRDLVEVRMDLGGVPVTLIDTAGLREASGDVIEEEGMRRARARASAADLTIAVVPMVDVDEESGVAEADVTVGSKADLLDSEAQRHLDSKGFDLMVSALTGDGMDRLESMLANKARAMAHDTGTAIVTRERHRAILREAEVALGEALDRPEDAIEIRAEALRRAADALGRATGAAAVDDLLDVIFRDFCIGK